eukprot:358445-Chlamydomonas_euryale.AAC.1
MAMNTVMCGHVLIPSYPCNSGRRVPPSIPKAAPAKQHAPLSLAGTLFHPNHNTGASIAMCGGWLAAGTLDFLVRWLHLGGQPDHHVHKSLLQRCLGGCSWHAVAGADLVDDSVQLSAKFALRLQFALDIIPACKPTPEKATQC